MNFKKRLTVLLFLVIFMALLIPATINIIVLYTTEQQTINTRLNEIKSNVLRILGETIKAPLWNYNNETVANICDSFFTSGYIKKIKVVDLVLNKIVYDKEVKKAGKITVKDSMEIDVYGKKIGLLYVEVSSLPYDKQFKNNILKTYLLLAFELFFTFLLIALIINKFILKNIYNSLVQNKTWFDGTLKNTNSKHFISVEKINDLVLEKISEINRYTEIFDNNVLTIKLNCSLEIINISKAFIKRTGFEPTELIGKQINQIFNSSNEEFINKLTAKNNYIFENIELKLTDKNNKDIWFNCRLEKIKNVEINLFFQDITYRKQIELLATTDSLTGLLNRRSIDEKLTYLKNLFDRHGTEFSVLLLDIDHFKKINDTYGHQIGDKVLVSFANIIKENIRNTDYASRWGGEEFLIVCVNTNLNNAKILAENLRKTIELFNFVEVEQVTCSIGVSSIIDCNNLHQLLKNVDVALYQAKATGRNKVVTK